MFKEYRKCLETAFKRMFQDILFFVLFVLKSCTFGFADYTGNCWKINRKFFSSRRGLSSSRRGLLSSRRELSNSHRELKKNKRGLSFYLEIRKRKISRSVQELLSLHVRSDISVGQG